MLSRFPRRAQGPGAAPARNPAKGGAWVRGRLARTSRRNGRRGAGGGGRASPPAARLPQTCGRGRPRTQEVRAFGATSGGGSATPPKAGLGTAGIPPRTSATRTTVGEPGAARFLGARASRPHVSMQWVPGSRGRRPRFLAPALRLPRTCGQDARGPGPRLRRGWRVRGRPARGQVRACRARPLCLTCPLIGC